MKIEKIKNEQKTYDINIYDNNKKLMIMYGGNGDLYWMIYDFESENDIITFEITKENYEIYKEFEMLYDAIKKHNIHKVQTYELEMCETQEDIKELYSHVSRMNRRLADDNSYKLLYRDEVISWHSDSTVYEDTNIVKIYKIDDSFILEFILYNKDMADENAIRFNNSRSRYKPFNACFMNMHHNLQNYDTDYHQIHIEEYLYQKRLEYK